MKTRIFTAALLLLIGVSFAGRTQAPPPSADVILNDAYSQAAKEHKKVMILFHASWCGWCKKMEASLNEPALKKSFDDNYVIKWLVVEESKGKENLENPGAMDLLTKYGGAKSGIPFWLVFDINGNLLADSQMRPAGQPLTTPGDNIGCPASEKEVTAFIDILKATSTIKEPELALIRARFLKNQPEPVKPAAVKTSK
ncbi:MAG: thioredoxin family protein [Mucilaginibacter sp.]